MNAAHFHLLINHVPILATFFSIAILAWGMYAKSDAIKKVALAGFIVAGLFAVVAYQSGESAEEIVEEIATVSHDDIEAHEESANIAQWLTILLGIGGAAGIYLQIRHDINLKNYLWVLFVYSLIAAGSLAYTAYQGGYIRHTEIENSAETADVDAGAVSGEEALESESGDDEEDDD